MPTAPASPAEQLPARTAAVWAALDAIVGAGTSLRVLDVGGGSGMFAVPLAQLGHEVIVVDPSADALATLRRRADTAGVGARVSGVQGDGDLLHEVLPPPNGQPGYDLALCHSVLEVVDDPAVTLREIAGALRPGGQVSIATANRAGAVLFRALSGHPRRGARAAHRSRPDPRTGPPRPPPVRPGRPARPRRGGRSRGRPVAWGLGRRRPARRRVRRGPRRGPDARAGARGRLALPRRRHRPAHPGRPTVSSAAGSAPPGLRHADPRRRAAGRRDGARRPGHPRRAARRPARA